MMRRLTAIGAAISVWLVATHADAQGKNKDFGDKGEFIFSADRLVPLFSYSRLAQDAVGAPANTSPTVTTTQTGISILWGSTHPRASDAELFFTVPRVGFDYTFAPNWTIGGDAVIFFNLGGSRDTEDKRNNVSTSVSAPSTVLLGIAPRAGYALELSDLVFLWLRAGVSFYTVSTKTTIDSNNSGTDHVNQFALDLDPQFVITPVKHFAFTVGLTADIPITGTHSQDLTQANVTTSASASSSVLFIGATAGLLGWF